MNIQTADYGTIIKYGTIQDLNSKIKLDGKTINDVKDIVDKDGVSLLEKSLVARKFDISDLLLKNNAKVNVVSKEGYNEFHYLAANINYAGAVEIAEILLKRNVSLIQQDKKYGNTALYTLCHEIFKKRSMAGMDLLEKCFEYSTDFDTCNKAGYSVRKLIDERGTDTLKAIMRKK